MTRRGQMPSGGQAVDDRPRRKLPSLQKQIEDYSRRAWYTVPSAHTYHGADPNAPREPVQLKTDERLAARVVDERLGGNTANLGRCDCPPCGCELRHMDGSYRPCEHDLACPHTGKEEDRERVSARLRALVADHPPFARALEGGVEEVYFAARLTPAEMQVAKYKHEGLSHEDIAFLTNRKAATCRVLYKRAMEELRRFLEGYVLEVAA